MIDLITKDISDPHVRENFFRLQNFVNRQVLFNGNFEPFDVIVPSKSAKFAIQHGLAFIPTDIISLSSDGDYNYYFLFREFDRQNIYLVSDGPCRARFLAGKITNPSSSKVDASAGFPFVAPGDIILPASPGFVFSAVNAQTSGYWLTSEGIPSNVVGIPVLFGDGVVTQAAVGTDAEASYVIGIYQHSGNGIGLTRLGTFNVVSGGDKRIDLNFPVQYTSPNVQLACRLESGSVSNLKVSLIVKGSSI